MFELYLRNFGFRPGPPRLPQPIHGIGGPPMGVNQGHGTSKNARTKTKQRRRKRRKIATKSKCINRR